MYESNKLSNSLYIARVVALKTFALGVFSAQKVIDFGFISDSSSLNPNLVGSV